MKTVIIIGAGASRDGKAPLMNEFFDFAQRLHAAKNTRLNALQPEYALVFDALAKMQVVHAKAKLDLNNLETVFGALDMARLLNKLPGYNYAGILKLRSALISLIAATLEESIEFQADYTTMTIQPPSSYLKFMQLVTKVYPISDNKRRSNVALITFNYDICLEVAIQWIGLKYDYCWNAATEPTGIPLLKLHGSLNWRRCLKCGKLKY